MSRYAISNEENLIESSIIEQNKTIEESYNLLNKVFKPVLRYKSTSELVKLVNDLDNSKAYKRK
jgi:hypothetical protein